MSALPRPLSRITRVSGFTLLELLVVIGIITLLAALVLSALTTVRRQAQAVVCKSNLRQISTAMTAYVLDTGYYPGCQHFEGFNSDRTFAVWPLRLRPYLTSGSPSSGLVLSVFHCPANDIALDWQIAFGFGSQYAIQSDRGFGYRLGEHLLESNNGMPFSYGYNDWGSANNGVDNAQQCGLGGDIGDPANRPGYGTELRATRVKVPALTIAIADSFTDGIFDYNIDPNDVNENPGKLHDNGANVLFCDGHVDWYLQSDLTNVNPATPEGTAMNQKWNNDYAVHTQN